MPTPETRRPRDEVARLGTEIFERRVRPTLTPGDDGKFVAIDIATEEYEIDINEWEAIARLRGHGPVPHIWLVRIGKPYRISFLTRFRQ